MGGGSRRRALRAGFGDAPPTLGAVALCNAVQQREPPPAAARIASHTSCLSTVMTAQA